MSDRTSRQASALAVALLGVAACNGHSSIRDADALAACAAATTLSFTPATGGSAEAYVCFGFDAGALGDRTIGRVAWTPPATGPVVLHHAKLYAVPGDFPDGPVACAGMPENAIGLDVWAPGTAELALPGDTGLVLPPGTTRLVVEAHVLRVGGGGSADAAVSLCAGPASPLHLAGMMRVSGPVPAIRPHHEETSSATCTLAGDLHLWSVWPHMHLVGKRIALELDATGGPITPLVDVHPWNFLNQIRHPLDADARAGDRIAVACTWSNPGDHYIFPGSLTENEMCNAAIIAWPVAAAVCTPEIRP